jgi:hypothetical protein
MAMLVPLQEIAPARKSAKAPSEQAPEQEAYPSKSKGPQNSVDDFQISQC